jgi:hypothetical protein
LQAWRKSASNDHGVGIIDLSQGIRRAYRAEVMPAKK